MKKTVLSLLAVVLLVAALPVPMAAAQASSPADLVPAGAPFYLSIDTRPGFVERILAIARRFSDQDFADPARSLDEVVQSLLGDRSATFADDVRPWLGDEIAITNPVMPDLTSLMMAGSSSQTPPGVAPAVIVSVAQASDAEAFLNKALDALAVRYATSVEETSYEGWTYFEVETADPPGLNIGLIDSYLVIGLGASSIQPFIDVRNGEELSLASTRGFQRIYGDMDPDAALRLYIGPSFPTSLLENPLFFNSMLQGLQSSETPIPGLDLSDPEALQRQMLDVMATFDGIGLDFRNTNDALIMDFVGGFDMDALDAVLGAPQPRLEQGVGEAIIARFPAASYGVIASRNVAAVYDSAAALARLDPQSAEQLGQAESMFREQTGLDLYEDVISWMDGSIAAGFIANPSFDLKLTAEDPQADPATRLPANLMIVLEATNPVKARTALDALVVVAQKEGAPVSLSEIGGVGVLTITPERAEDVPLQIALIDGYLTLITGENMALAIETAQGGPNYTQNPEWARLTGIANADGPFLATLEIRGIIDGILEPHRQEIVQGALDDRSVTEFMLSVERIKQVETAAIIAPASPDGGPARFSFILTLTGE